MNNELIDDVICQLPDNMMQSSAQCVFLSNLEHHITRSTLLIKIISVYSADYTSKK